MKRETYVEGKPCEVVYEDDEIAVVRFEDGGHDEVHPGTITYEPKEET